WVYLRSYPFRVQSVCPLLSRYASSSSINGQHPVLDVRRSFAHRAHYFLSVDGEPFVFDTLLSVYSQSEFAFQIYFLSHSDILRKINLKPSQRESSYDATVPTE